jgi:ring-1,2-phenylacetyl-CoA epoxidase subunit PaaE
MRWATRFRSCRRRAASPSKSIPEASHTYLAFAGGSGITPVLSLIRSVLAREPKSRFTLVYANRRVNTIMFREEIEDLKNLHMGRLRVIHVLEQDAQEIELFTGRVTEEKCADLFRGLDRCGRWTWRFICGPEPMMKGIARALEAHGVDEGSDRYELFTSAAQQGRLPQRAVDQGRRRGQGDPAPSRSTGRRAASRWPADQTVLEAALAHDIDVPFSCRAGVCSTCRCKVTEGEVAMDTNHALEDYEVARGFALSCQSRPV